MTSIRRPTPSRLLPVIAIVLLAVAACSASAPIPVASPSGPGAPGSLLPGGLTPGPANPTPVPGAPTDPGGSDPGGSVPGGGPGAGSGSGSNPGGSVSVPGNPGNGDTTGSPPDVGGSGPIVFQPKIVTPTAGLRDIHAVGATKLLANVDGRHVTIRVDWWSGVEPCNVLAGIDVARDGSTITLTVREGDTGRLVACDEMALYKGAFVDLGELDPGTWTVKAFGDAPAIQVVVAG